MLNGDGQRKGDFFLDEILGVESVGSGHLGNFNHIMTNGGCNWHSRHMKNSAIVACRG